MKFRYIAALAVAIMLATPVAAQAARKIDKAKMHAIAGAKTSAACQRYADTWLMGPEGAEYVCGFVHVTVKWHPPLAPNTGYANTAFRIVPVHKNFLSDIVCATRYWFRQYGNYTVLLNPNARYSCSEAADKWGPTVAVWYR